MFLFGLKTSTFFLQKIVVAVVGDDCVFNPQYDTPIRRFVEMIDSGTEMPPLTDPFMQTWYWVNILSFCSINYLLCNVFFL